MKIPTKEQERLAREIDLIAGDFHAVGNHNRAIARQRIAEYRSSVDDIIETRVSGQRQVWPTEGLKNLVEGNRKEISVVKPLLLIFGLCLIAYAIVFGLAAVMVK